MADFKVITWNVQNLFPVGHEDGPKDITTFNNKISSLASVISQEAPDVLALQEIGDKSSLAELQNSLSHQMPYYAFGTPDSRGIRVAFLSTQPIQAEQDLQIFPEQLLAVQSKDQRFEHATTERMGRGALEIQINISGKEVTLITAHFKSKLNSYTRSGDDPKWAKFRPKDEGERSRYTGYGVYRRAAEAVTIRHRINELLTDTSDVTIGLGKEKAVIFCGDLNDEIDAATTQIIQGPLGSELDKKIAFSLEDKGDDFRMWNVAYLLPGFDEGLAFTRKYRGRNEIIDHIFASHILVNPHNIPTTYTIMNPDPLPIIDDNPNIRQNEPGSDHAAVVAIFNV